ncbi:MAG: OsmC family protein [Planctomycetota bacterium]|nr:OsmC family protein [Planctomycetota bacterium]
MTTQAATQATMEAKTQTTHLNGINLPALRGAMEAIKADPKNGVTNWTVRSQWKGGTRSDHAVDGFGMGGQHVPRSFVMKADEPRELIGTDAYPNPQEYLLAGLNACMLVGYAAAATAMGVKLTRLEIETTGDIDLRGFLGLDPAVPAGYDRLKQVVHIAGDGTPAQFAKMHEMVHRTSPNYFNITRAIKVESELEVG